jgi:thiol:disulfide interchange protein
MKKFKSIALVAVLLFMCSRIFCVSSEPFGWGADYDEKSGKLSVSVSIAKNYYLYDNTANITVTSDGKQFKPSVIPEAVSHKDEFGEHLMYAGAGIFKWEYNLKPESSCEVVIKYHGCRQKTEFQPAMCMMPAEKKFSFKVKHKVTHADDRVISSEKNLRVELSEKKDKPESIAEKEEPAGKEGRLELLFTHFKLQKTGGGYMSASEFLNFLNYRISDGEGKVGSSFGDIPVKSLAGLIFFIIFGGIMLNLTPCVLPMIPINLGIIGAGAGGKSKAFGFMRGGIYGLGIALSYGGLGVVTVLTGAKFGALNSSPLFNYIIAVIFILLALGMFDILSIDFSKYSSRFSPAKGVNGGKIGEYIGIFAMGSLSALLGGACVAPVVIAVLLYSTTEYSAGNTIAILLPFLLGIGMALPWPFAGAGVTVLPKPGMWMVKVKYVFGILILIFAGYYAYLGYGLCRSSASGSSVSSIYHLENELEHALKENKPVFIDFWATWCKSCHEMERSTFNDPAVKKELKDFVVIKFQAEDIKEKKISDLLDRFKIPGLPGFVILTPENKEQK